MPLETIMNGLKKLIGGFVPLPECDERKAKVDGAREVIETAIFLMQTYLEYLKNIEISNMKDTLAQLLNHLPFQFKKLEGADSLGYIECNMRYVIVQFLEVVERSAGASDEDTEKAVKELLAFTNRLLAGLDKMLG